MTIPVLMLDGAKRQRSEMQILRAIMGYLAARRIQVDRVNTGAMRQPDPRRRKGYRVVRFEKKGTPDLRGIIRPWGGMKYGVPLFVEVKRPQGRLTAHQAFRLRELRAAGAIAFMASSVADVAAQLDAEGVPPL
jgi:hypothetical protein